MNVTPRNSQLRRSDVRLTSAEWTIPLQAFADQGMNLANVSTITIGFGTKNSPAAGGSGQMYCDDIRLYRPSIAP